MSKGYTTIRKIMQEDQKNAYRHGGRVENAQGIEAVSFFTAGKKDTSG
jgi:hypothetical protein